MSIERKYKKRLNRNGWMAKLQRFVWGSKTPDFMGYCPFFWFTWLSLVVAPFKFLLIVVAIIVAGPFFGLRELWERIPKRPSKPNYEKLLEIHDAIEKMGEEDFLKLYVGTNIYRWIQATPDWRNCVAAAVATRARKEAAKQATVKRDRRRLQWLANRLHYVIKPVIYVVCSVGAIFAIRFLVKFFVWLWPLIYWPKVWQIALGVIALIISVCLVVLACMGIELLWRFYRRKCPKCPDKVGFWTKVWNVVRIPFAFIGETIDVIYTRECPLIEWGDESGPIEYNE